MGTSREPTGPDSITSAGARTKGARTKGTREKGRGAGSNEPSRYVSTRSEAEDDGWSLPAEFEDEFAQSKGPQTQVFKDRTVRLITANQSPDIPFSQSINPYKGCEHGCIYCFARPTHTYLDLSAGLDFETKIFRKSDPRPHLIEELAKPGYRCSVIAMGTNTDPYQPLEQPHQVTREILQTLLELRHPVSIVTKSKLILRDLDLLTEFAELGLVSVNISVTTLDNGLKGKLEPRTAGPAARLRTIASLRERGIPTGAMVAPVIPFINDHEIERIVQRTAEAGAQVIRYILIRLPLEVRPLFEEWLRLHYPGKAARVMSAICDTRGGTAYRSEWGKRMVGEGPVAMLIAKRFSKAVRDQTSLADDLPTLRTDLFTPPDRRKVQAARLELAQHRDGISRGPQMSLF